MSSEARTFDATTDDNAFDRALAQTIEENIQDLLDIADASARDPIATGTVLVAHSVACVLFPLPYVLLGVMHATASASRGINGKRRRN